MSVDPQKRNISVCYFVNVFLNNNVGKKKLYVCTYTVETLKRNINKKNVKMFYLYENKEIKKKKRAKTVPN